MPKVKVIKTVIAVLMCSLFIPLSMASDKPTTIRIGSKTFAESHILAEMSAQLLEANGFLVERRHGLGGTLIVYQALQSSDIDLYPEYTGTIDQAILKQSLKPNTRQRELAQKQLQFVVPFGFNNSYAIAMSRKVAKERGITRLSDLRDHRGLAIALSLEFLNREDGWHALKKHYQLPQTPKGIEHALAYPAIAAGQLAATDAYTTDGEIDAKTLILLDDDKQFFPTYYAGLLARSDLPSQAIELLERLSNSINENTMQNLNRRVSLEGEKPEQVARDFLNTTGFVNAAPMAKTNTSIDWQRIRQNTWVHIKLTATALLLACSVAIPLALFLSQYPPVARALLYVAGLIQTIPSLALLALLIPWLGLGETPAILALFLYSLLPVLRNTLTGIFAVDPLLKQVASGMGLNNWQRLWNIELPLAVPQLLAGVKTAAIISIGTATLAAFVGAGGLGEPIITGLTLNDHTLILQGAIPAALLAVVTEFIFEWVERYVLPQHLRDQNS